MKLLSQMKGVLTDPRGGRAAGALPPPQREFLLFLHTFPLKIVCVGGWRPSPNGKSWIRHCGGRKLGGHNVVPLYNKTCYGRPSFGACYLAINFNIEGCAAATNYDN